MEHCYKLQRLFLSFNELSALSSIKNLNRLTNLQEICLDGNPVSNDKTCKRDILAKVPSLKKFDSKRVTDEEKRVAEKMFMRDEFRKREIEMLAFTEEKRRMTIRDAENEWLAHQMANRNNKMHRQSKPIETSSAASTTTTNDIHENNNNNNNNREANNCSIVDIEVLTNRSRPSSSLQHQQNSNLNSTFQNYIQQYQNTSSSTTAGAAVNNSVGSGKLRLVSLRSSLPNVHAPQANHQSNGDKMYSPSPPVQTTSQFLPSSAKSNNQTSTQNNNSNNNNSNNNSIASSSSSSINSNEIGERHKESGTKFQLGACEPPSSSSQEDESATARDAGKGGDDEADVDEEEEEGLSDFNLAQRQTLINPLSRSNSAAATLYGRGGAQQLTPLKTVNSIPSNASSTNSTSSPTATQTITTTTTTASVTTTTTTAKSAQVLPVQPKRTIGLNGGSNILEDNCMFFYGNKSLELIDLKLDQSLLAQVNTLSFHFIDYSEFLVKNFIKLRNKFINLNVRTKKSKALFIYLRNIQFLKCLS